MNIPIKLLSDEKGYLDRECPNDNCLYTFKINVQDWTNKVSDEEVHCPMCGHVDTSDKWWTQEQLESMREIAINYAVNMIQEKLDDAFGSLAKSTRRNKYVKITYKPGNVKSGPQILCVITAVRVTALLVQRIFVHVVDTTQLYRYLMSH